jgi:hypothetical protein
MCLGTLAEQAVDGLEVVIGQRLERRYGSPASRMARCWSASSDR